MSYHPLLHLRSSSLVRGNLVAITALVLATWISGFPHLIATHKLLLPLVLSVLGTADTARCLRKRWDFYHGGVLLCLYMDLMVVTLVAFLYVYPFFV